MSPTTSRTQRWFNAVARWLLRSPLHRVLSGKVMLIEVTGRRTGRRYVVPIAYAERDGAVLMGVAKATWLRNLAPHRPVTLTVRGERRVAHPEVITDEDRVAELYPAILRHNSAHGRIQQLRLEPDGSVNRADLRAGLDRGLVLVRLT